MDNNRDYWNSIGAFVLSALLGILAILASGCGPPCYSGSSGQCITTDRHVQGQDIAIKTVWRDAFGETGDPPAVIWVIQGDAPCDNGPQGCFSSKIGTLLGDFLDYSWTILVMRDIYNDEYFRWVVFSHELLHAHFSIQDGDPDENHLRPEWKTVPSEMSIAIANAGIYRL